MASNKLNTSHSSTPDIVPWQREIRQLYQNHSRIGVLLNQSTMLPAEARLAFQYLRKELIKALERFNSDLDHPVNSSQVCQKVVFEKHVNIMHCLNKSINELVKKYTYC